jgi:predicted HNH restriction endonuclease
MTGREKYAEYLRSEHWRKLRIKTLMRWGAYCQGCGASEDIEVHHVRYLPNWEDTTIKDLVPLCGRCHDLAHSAPPKYNKRGRDSLLTYIKRITGWRTKGKQTAKRRHAFRLQCCALRA